MQSRLSRKSKTSQRAKKVSRGTGINRKSAPTASKLRFAAKGALKKPAADAKSQSKPEQPRFNVIVASPRVDVEASAEPDHSQDQPRSRGGLPMLALTALGVVFGDIGTSPLYALKECTSGTHGVEPSHANVLGLLSLILWSLTMVVTVKYLTFVMRAHNRGEGGILALLALVPPKATRVRGSIGWLAALILLGAALLYGDGIITPAISVLSAVEGLAVATPALEPAVVPVTCVVLGLLFLAQRWGTAKVGKVFGPVMLLWFSVLAVLGVWHIAESPGVLWSLSPHHAVRFFADNGFRGFAVLGAVVLAVTGGEALYADMGHFGVGPIRLSWYGLVMPSLFLNYLGQGAMLLEHPERASNPFYGLVSSQAATYALVALASFATVIASQALITGVYSLTNQAVQLGFFPRVTVQHTSSTNEGQIYVPEINYALGAACIVLVIAFEKSANLAGAYGVAVTGTMGITSIAFYVAARKTWGWSRAKALPLVALFLAFDLPFFASNLLKFFAGGFVPIVVGAVLFFSMITWKRGRFYLGRYYASRALPMEKFLAMLSNGVVRVPGACVFMASSSAYVPPILSHHLRHSRSLHETVLLLTVTTEPRPRVPKMERVEVSEIGQGLWRVVVRYGFFEAPDVPAALRMAVRRAKLHVTVDAITYYIGRETLLVTRASSMGRFSEAFFAAISRNSLSATTYFAIPPNRVVELGMQIDL